MGILIQIYLYFEAIIGDGEAEKLRKKLEKIQWQLTNNPDLSAAKRKKLEDKFDEIKEKLKAFEDKLKSLGVTKLVHKTHRQ